MVGGVETRNNKYETEAQRDARVQLLTVGALLLLNTGPVYGVIRDDV